MAQEPAQPQVHTEPAQDDIEALELQPMSQGLTSSTQQDLQQREMQQQQELRYQQLQPHQHHHHEQLEQQGNHHQSQDMQPGLQASSMAPTMQPSLNHPVPQVNTPQSVQPMQMQQMSQMMTADGHLTGVAISMAPTHMVSTPTQMMPMINMQTDQAYISQHVEHSEEMMTLAVTRFENLFPACVPAVLENIVPEDLINRARGWNKQDLTSVLSSQPIRSRLDSMYIPKHLFDQAVKMRHDYTNGAPRTRFAVEVAAEDNDASNRRKIRFRCVACNRQHGFHSALQHVGASLRCPKIRGELDWAQWNPCPWACFGIVFIAQCLRPMSQNPKRKAEDFDITMKHPGPAAIRPPTGEPAMMPTATLLRPALPPVSGTLGPVSSTLGPASSALRGSPSLPYNHALASSTTRMTGPGGMTIHGMPPGPGGQGLTADSVMMNLEKLKDDLDEWQNSMSEQLNHYMGVIQSMQDQVMQIKGQEGEQAAMEANEPGNGEA
eukprot:m.52486 g.52486  ORF g.52486 m.52486 type:complete len:493 (+) comp13507_c0_seq1:130-1608(+)